MENITQSNLTDEIYQFILNNFPRARQKSVELSDQLLDGGIVDSLGLLTIVDFIETTFGITVTDVDVGVENFGTISAIAAFVSRSLNKKNQSN